MAYDELSIALARERGAPDPEGNVQRAAEICELLSAFRFDEARARLEQITDPVIRADLEQEILFSETCLCIPREDLIAATPS